MTNADGMPEDLHDATLVRLLRQLTTETDRLAELFGDAHGLHRTDLNALEIILTATRRGRRISPGQLARALRLSASATTAVLDRLEYAGYVERDRSPDDRRRVELRISSQALPAREQYFQPLGVEVSRAWARFTPQERATIVEFLTASIDATLQVRARFAGNGG